LEGHKIQALNLTSKLPGLALTHESAEQQKWTEYDKGWVSIDHWLCTTKLWSSCKSVIWTITVWTKR